MERAQGFIVAAWEEGRGARSAARRAGTPGRIFLTGRLEDHRSFGAVVHAPRPALYLPLEHGPAALACTPSAAHLPIRERERPRANEALLGGSESRVATGPWMERRMTWRAPQTA